MSNGGTEAINGVIEKTRRLAHGFRSSTSYRIRIAVRVPGRRTLIGVGGGGGRVSWEVQ